MEPKKQTVRLDHITVDGGLDVRMRSDPDTVVRYAEVLDALPPIPVVRLEDGTLLLAGGFHRFEAARKAGRKTIAAEVRDGAREDAQAFAALDNARHGLPLNVHERDAAILRLVALGHKQVDVAREFGLSKSRLSHILEELKELRGATSSPPDARRVQAFRRERAQSALIERLANDAADARRRRQERGGKAGGFDPLTATPAELKRHGYRYHPSGTESPGGWIREDQVGPVLRGIVPPKRVEPKYRTVVALGEKIQTKVVEGIVQVRCPHCGGTGWVEVN